VTGEPPRIRVSESFAASAGPEADEVIGLVRSLGAAPVKGERHQAVVLGSGSTVGLRRTPEQLDLLFMVRDDQRRVPCDGAPLWRVSRNELIAMGVPDALVRQVQGARSDLELDALGLPPEVLKAVRFKWLQLSPTLAGEDLRPTLLAAGADHLDEFLHGRITKLLLDLDPGQERIVRLGGAGAIAVKGVAGSGKTAVLVHRIHRIVRDWPMAPPRILVVSYTNMLVEHAQELAASVGIAHGAIEVTTLHSWCARFAGRIEQIVTDREKEALIESACRASQSRHLSSRIWDSPLKFWADEFHLIKGRLLQTREQYLAVDRIGAGRGLNEDLRSLAWEAFTRYEQLKAAQQVRDWDDLVREAHDRLREQGARRRGYDYVFVDEAQDLTPAAMKVLAMLAEPQMNLFVAFDPAQSIYERGFRWKDCGIQVHPARSFALRRNFRNTIEILDTARGLLNEETPAAAEGDAEGPLAPEPVARRGALPGFIVDSDRKLYDAMAADIERLIGESKPPVPPGNVAVLCYPNAEARRVAAALRQRHINTQCQGEGPIRTGDPSVKVLHLKSAKGLEFPVVYLVASGSLFERHSLDEAEQQAWVEELRRLFYMAITRAMSRLTIVHAKGDPPPFPLDRAGTPPTRYLLMLGEDAIFDRGQALLWQAQPHGPMTHREAVRFVAARDSAGWRLPTRAELLELRRTMPAGLFPDIREWFWTAEPRELEHAWAISFQDGTERDWPQTSAFRVRLVRSESASDPGAAGAGILR
jgi:superfamily I DNA/RNA helicase